MAISDHVDHDVEMLESETRCWSINITPEGNIEAFDSETGDGWGDYRLYCHNCLREEPVPGDADIDFV